MPSLSLCQSFADHNPPLTVRILNSKRVSAFVVCRLPLSLRRHDEVSERHYREVIERMHQNRHIERTGAPIGFGKHHPGDCVEGQRRPVESWELHEVHVEQTENETAGKRCRQVAQFHMAKEAKRRVTAERSAQRIEEKTAKDDPPRQTVPRPLQETQRAAPEFLKAT